VTEYTYTHNKRETSYKNGKYRSKFLSQVAIAYWKKSVAPFPRSVIFNDICTL